VALPSPLPALERPAGRGHDGRCADQRRIVDTGTRLHVRRLNPAWLHPFRPTFGTAQLTGYDTTYVIVNARDVTPDATASVARSLRIDEASLAETFETPVLVHSFSVSAAYRMTRPTRSPGAASPRPFS